MSELIPGATKRITKRAKDQVSRPAERTWIAKLSPKDIEAYAPEGVIRFCKENKPPKPATLEQMQRFWLRLPTVLNKDSESFWVSNVVRAAKEHTRGIN